MATYYVSATTGNDSNDGSTAALAKATVGAGENLATSAGDVVYIAPGNYREAVVHGYSGTAGGRIYFIGDPDCEHFPGVEQGIVRITAAADNTEFADDTNGGVVVKSNGRDYITWKNVHVDGISGGINAYNDNNSGYGFYSNSENDYMETIDCVAQHFYMGFRYMAYAYGCGAVGCYYGFSNGYVANKCIAHACVNGFGNQDEIYNSISVGQAFYGFVNCGFGQNLASFGGYYGILSSLSNSHFSDTIIGGAQYGYSSFNTSTYGTISGSYFFGMNYMGRYGGHHQSHFGYTRYQWSNNTDPAVGVNLSTDMQGDGLIHPQAGMVLYSINNLKDLAYALKPTLFNKPLRGRTIVENETIYTGATSVDILGKPRKMGSGNSLGPFNGNAEGTGDTNTTSSRDVGPWEFSHVYPTSSVASSSEGIAIGDEGLFCIPVAVSESSAITASVFVKHESGSGIADLTKKPQLILKYCYAHPTTSVTTAAANNSTEARALPSGSQLNIQLVSSSAADNEWTKLSVSGSFPNKSREVELILYNATSGSTYDGSVNPAGGNLGDDRSLAIFSDIEIE